MIRGENRRWKIKWEDKL